MPIDIDEIERENERVARLKRPLTQKIFDLLAAKPRKAFRFTDITEALGDGLLKLTPHARSGGELFGFLLADIGLLALTAEQQLERQKRYQVALYRLVSSGRVRVLKYKGESCYAVANAALPPAGRKRLKAAEG